MPLCTSGRTTPKYLALALDEGVCKEEGEEGTVDSENDEVVEDRHRDTDRGMDEGVCMGEA